MACEGVKQLLVESEGPQQLIPDIRLGWQAGRRTMHQGTDGQAEIWHCVCIFVFRNMTCSPGQLVC